MGLQFLQDLNQDLEVLASGVGLSDSTQDGINPPLCSPVVPCQHFPQRGMVLKTAAGTVLREGDFCDMEKLFSFPELFQARSTVPGGFSRTVS